MLSKISGIDYPACLKKGLRNSIKQLRTMVNSLEESSTEKWAPYIRRRAFYLLCASRVSLIGRVTKEVEWERLSVVFLIYPCENRPMDLPNKYSIEEIQEKLRIETCSQSDVAVGV